MRAGWTGVEPTVWPHHTDLGEAVGAWLGVWHLWVDARPQSLRLGCLPPVWASRAHQPHRDLRCGPSAWSYIKLDIISVMSCGNTGLTLINTAKKENQMKETEIYQEMWKKVYIYIYISVLGLDKHRGEKDQNFVPSRMALLLFFYSKWNN